MTAKDAFAIAFDEAIVMDAMPGNDMPRNSLPQKPSAQSGQKKDAAAIPTSKAQLSPTSEMKTLAEHDAERHKKGYKPGDPCSWRDAYGMSNMTLQEATAKGLANKKFPSKVFGEDGQSTPEPQELNPEVQEEEIQQMVQNPQMIETAQTQLLTQPEELETLAGEIPVQTTVQKAIVENLEESAATGNPQANESLNELKEKVDEGEITTAEPSRNTQSNQTQHMGSNGQVQQPEQPRMEFTSSDSSLTVVPSADTVAILQNDPSKKEEYQKIVDTEAALQNSKDDAEKKDISNSLRILKRMFYGEDRPDEGSPATTETAEAKPSEEPPQPEVPQPEPRHEEAKSAPTSEPASEKSQKEKPSRKPLERKAPSDDEFRVKGKENEYKVGGMTYVDVSGKGLFRTALASFLAGLQGKGIITGWDKLNGTWDQMKRSENGERVRDGILAARFEDALSKYSDMEGLSEMASLKLEAIREMMSGAKNPQAKIKALNQFEEWQAEYADELGALEKHEPDEVFQPLPNDYKGKKPPLSILGKPKGFEADTEYGKQVAYAIRERLGSLGFPISEDDMPEVSVGPSATTIEFKVPPTFDMASAKSNKVRESLKGAVGGPVSSIEYASGKKDTLAITITNKDMRPVYFTDVMHSKEWKDFSKKSKIPVALGKDSRGKDKLLDLTKMPHMMVTGATRSGKSVFMLSAINSAEMAKTPDELRIVCIDPKEEFKSQKGSPHLLYPIPSKKRDIANVVASLKAEMEKRISMVGGTEETYDPEKNEFTGNSNRNIDGFNEAHPEEKMPHIMVVFDEVADVMKDPEVGEQVKADMDRIMALGRSVGINCILATQRHDVASLPGSIQANMPAHLMFRASESDAKASKAAKSLAGNGDYILAAEGEETRGRGCFITDEDVAAIPAYYRDHMEGSPEETDAEEPTETPENEKPIEPATEAIKEEEEDIGEDWTAADNRDDAIAILEKIRDSAKSKAFEEYKKSKKAAGDRTKYHKAIEKAEADFNDEMSIVDSQFPELIQEGDALMNESPPPENPEAEKSGEAEEEDDELALFPSPQRQLEEATQGLKKQIAKWQKSIGMGEISADEAKKLHAEAMQRLNAAKKAMKEGVDGKKATGEQIHAILNPTPKPAEPAASTPAQAEESKEPTPEETAGQEQKKQEEQDKQRRSTVPPPKFYTGGSAIHSNKATKMLTPKEQKQLKETLVPPGWDFVTENTFKAPAQTEGGVIYIQHPTNGSWGYIYKDSKTGDKSLYIDTDTTHPEYKGLVKNAEGQWEEPAGVKEAKAAWKHEAKYGDPKKAKELKNKYYHMRSGRDALDEAPDNKTIVANAVAQALDLLKGE